VFFFFFSKASSSEIRAKDYSGCGKERPF